MKVRCQARIYVRDCYRRTGRGKTGFEMHYEMRQCSHAAKPDKRMCGKHKDVKSELGWYEHINPPEASK